MPKLLPLLNRWANSVPPSLNLTSAPSTSIIKSPPTSKVRSPASEMVEPLIVMSSTVRVVSVPRLVMLGCAAVANGPTKLVAVIVPLTSNSVEGSPATFIPTEPLLVILSGSTVALAVPRTNLSN